MRIIATLACFAALAGGAFGCEATRSVFDELRPGMAVAEVEKIVGCAGEPVAETGEGSGKVSIQRWPGNGEEGSNLTLTFLDDRLIEKAQSKLK